MAESSVALPPVDREHGNDHSAFSFAHDPSTFDPESLRILTGAFEDAWRALQTVGTTFHVDGHASKRAKSSPAAS